MSGSLRVARIFGIDVGLHYSWFFVFALVTWSLSAVYFPARFPSWTNQLAWGAGLVTSLLFFASVLAHEFAHSIVARRLGIEVEGITLFVFGGMASITREADRARDEFAIAIAGPASSVALGFLFGLIAWAAGTAGPAYRLVVPIAWWLATINLMLGLFNLIPGFPMDGGRVLRAIIWGLSRDFWLATKLAAGGGLAIAYLMMLGGLFAAVSGSVANALWLVFVGWFLSSAAQGSYRHAKMRDSLKGVTVDQAMDRDFTPVFAYTTLAEAFEHNVGPRRLMAVPVMTADASRVLGLLTEQDLRRIPRERWDRTPVSEAITATSQIPPVAPDDQVTDVLSSLGSHEFAAAPVVQEGRLVGLLTNSGIVARLRLNGRRRQKDEA